MIVYIRTISQDYEIFWFQNMLLCMLNHESRLLFYSSPYNDSLQEQDALNRLATVFISSYINMPLHLIVSTIKTIHLVLIPH